MLSIVNRAGNDVYMSGIFVLGACYDKGVISDLFNFCLGFISLLFHIMPCFYFNSKRSSVAISISCLFQFYLVFFIDA
jgi:hypothetical protein